MDSSFKDGGAAKVAGNQKGRESLKRLTAMVQQVSAKQAARNVESAFSHSLMGGTILAWENPKLDLVRRLGKPATAHVSRGGSPTAITVRSTPY